jgi:hypothetical protein
MISLSWNSNFEPNSLDLDKHIGKMMQAYRGLPRHIARKHLGASFRRVLKPGVGILRRNTPPLGTRRGRRKKGEKPRSTGDLRRAATVRVGQTGKNKAFDAFVYGVLGYRAGLQSRKAIWLEFGTSRGARAFEMMKNTVDQFGPVVAGKLANEMALALEKAVKELAGGKNPGYGG